jgi:hypothetical protein
MYRFMGGESVLLIVSTLAAMRRLYATAGESWIGESTHKCTHTFSYAGGSELLRVYCDD